MHTKATRKALILCQGLVYDYKTFPWTEALPVLALFSKVRRYYPLLLCNCSASGTLCRLQAACVSSACCFVLWLHDMPLHILSLLFHNFAKPTRNGKWFVNVLSQLSLELSIQTGIILPFYHPIFMVAEHICILQLQNGWAELRQVNKNLTFKQN